MPIISAGKNTGHADIFLRRALQFSKVQKMSVVKEKRAMPGTVSEASHLQCAGLRSASRLYMPEVIEFVSGFIMESSRIKLLIKGYPVKNKSQA